MMEVVIFFGELAVFAAVMEWARWRLAQTIMAVVATVIFWSVITPVWNQPHTGVLRTDPSLFFVPWIALPSVFIILFSAQNFFQTKRYVWVVTGLIAISALAILFAIGYENRYSI